LKQNVKPLRPALIVVHSLFLFVALAAACKSKPGAISSSPPPPVYFSKNWKAEIRFPYFVEGNRIGGIVRSKTGALIAYLPTNNGLLQSTSSDNGRTWTPPSLIFSDAWPAFPIFLGRRLHGVFTLEYVANGGQFYFHATNNEDWDDPSPIRDTNWGGFQPPGFAIDSLGNLYCAWTDSREGNWDVYFSSSFDGGKTWAANVLIDGDQSGQEQVFRGLLSSPDGRLYALWDDNRNPQTIFDIYCSSSHDRGKTWSPGVKINDDTTHTFQIEVSSVINAQGNLYVAWTDYRDKGARGDILANIYFARSTDGGRFWSPNVRISHAHDGHNWLPLLVLAADGRLLCTWRSYDDNSFGDVFFSYSRDGGQTWSEPARVNDDLERAYHDHRSIGWLGENPNGNEVIGWLDGREGQAVVYLAQLLAQPDSTRPERTPRQNAAATEARIALTVESGETLFQDHFVTSPSPQWEVDSGTWICTEHTYIGYGAREARSFAGSRAWSDCIFSGRFKLDPLDHKAALLYLRVAHGNDGRLSFYRLDNFFRNGVTLEYFDGKSLLPLANMPYPFQKDRWYTFRTLVKGNVLNHFIDDSLFIATDKLTHLSRGKVGIGANVAPAYYKDILVTAIK
jgi:hypothetical protein